MDLETVTTSGFIILFPDYSFGILKNELKENHIVLSTQEEQQHILYRTLIPLIPSR